MWVHSLVEVKLIKVIPFYRSGTRPCCRMMVSNIGLEMITGNAQITFFIPETDLNFVANTENQSDTSDVYI